MSKITVKCIANSYHNPFEGISLSKGQEIEVEEARATEGIKTKYLVKVETPTKTEETTKATTRKKATSK